VLFPKVLYETDDNDEEERLFGLARGYPLPLLYSSSFPFFSFDVFIFFFYLYSPRIGVLRFLARVCNVRIEAEVSFSEPILSFPPTDLDPILHS
jgi:hypothetical protein